MKMMMTMMIVHSYFFVSLALVGLRICVSEEVSPNFSSKLGSTIAHAGGAAPATAIPISRIFMFLKKNKRNEAVGWKM